MKFAVLLLCASLVLAIRDDDPVLDADMIAEINEANAGWTAGFNPRFEGVTWREAQAMCGTEFPDDNHIVPPYHNDYVGDIPDTFESAKEFSECKDIILKVLDQGKCGSCWAFGAVEALEDRRCIRCDHVQELLSEQYVVDCDDGNYGCQGGYLDRVWDFLTDDGSVSEDCYPYFSGKSGKTGQCQKSCPGTGSFTKHHAEKGTMVQPRREKDIQTEIMKNGPVEAGFTVYQDFFSYTGGVYRHRSGSAAGGHAVEMQGWGNEGGDDYWLIKNSWGTGWGVDGYFKILRGKNECGIESNIVAALASC